MNKKAKYAWIPMIPGTFYAFITTTYIAHAQIGFNLPWGVSYAIGGILAAAYLVAVIWYGKKRAK